jgi:Rps23 Pro-64 3,4-dihydroxylase Tpa1-like proline 4-hydroxylase
MSLIVVPNFLDQHNFVLLYDEIFYGGWQANNRDTAEDIKNNFYSSRVSLSIKTSNPLIYLSVASYVRLKLKKFYKEVGLLKRWHVNGQFFGQESNFHIDVPHKNDTSSLTCVIFTNTEWSTYWGGEFCLYDPRINEYKYVSYVPNTAVIFPSEFEHCGKSPNINADSLRTSVAFIFNRNSSAFPQL